LILSFETSTKAFSVSLQHAEERVDLEIIRSTFHSQSIVSVADFLLKSISASVKEVEEVYCGIGPGSFTGIRIGLTFANTLCETLGIPVAGISSLDLLAFESGKWYNAVVSFIRSRKNEVYTASYREGKRVSEYLALGKGEFELFLRRENPGCIAASEEDIRSLALESVLAGREMVFSFPWAKHAYSLAKLCDVKPEKKFLKPLYVRNF
jgi:tRNA threonylcarbamoyl adenosine modification protein YeaZ